MAEVSEHCGVTFSVIPETLSDDFKKHFPSFTDGLVKSDPGDFVMGPRYAAAADDLYNFEIRPSDVWVASFPKCGTTWTQEMVWLLSHDLDYEGAKMRLNDRSPFIEFPFIITEANELYKTTITEALKSMKSPRNIKTHLPLYLLPPKLLDTCKVVYVARNPKDVIVSYYFHHKLIKMQDFHGNMEEFAEYFMENELLYSPFFPHLLQYWSLRNHPNLLFIFYEDLKKDLSGEIKKVALFLGKSLTEEQLVQLKEHLHFSNFVSNEAVNKEDGKKAGSFAPEGRFIRKGKTGDWKNHFSPDLNRRIDEWIESNLSGSDLKFVTELEHQD